MLKFHHSIYRIFVLSFISFWALVSCSKEIGESPIDNRPTTSISISIEEAKDYFDQNFSQGTQNKTSKRRKRKNEEYWSKTDRKKLKWTKAVKRLSTTGESVLIPMDLGELRWGFNDSQKTLYDNNLLNYTVMYKDSGGQMKTEWVTLMPDEDWVKGERKFFSGKALIRDWDGEFLRYYSYTKDGMVKSTRISEATGNEKVAGGVKYGQFCYDYAYNCDPPTYPTVRAMYDIQCVSSVCVPVIEWEDTPWVPVTVGGGSGWSGSGPSSSAPSSGGPSGGEYVPYQCNSSLAPGTSVSPNQIPPCQTFVSAGGWNLPPLVPASFKTYSSLDDVLADPQLYPIWDKLNEQEKQFFRDHWRLAPSGLANYGITIAAGLTLWNNSDEDNSNANAFRHALLTGLNATAWNSETLAKDFGRLHELNGGQTQNQHEMDRLNNEAGAEYARTYRLPDDLLFAILGDFEEQFPKLKRLVGNSPNGAIVPVNTQGRKYPPGYIEIP